MVRALSSIFSEHFFLAVHCGIHCSFHVFSLFVHCFFFLFLFIFLHFFNHVALCGSFVFGSVPLLLYAFPRLCPYFVHLYTCMLVRKCIHIYIYARTYLFVFIDLMCRHVHGKTLKYNNEPKESTDYLFRTERHRKERKSPKNSKDTRKQMNRLTFV